MSDGGKGKRKAELVDLCEKAAEMKQAKLEDTVEELRLFRPKACSPDGDSPEAKDDSPDYTNQ